jgi:hypothetical protein
MTLARLAVVLLTTVWAGTALAAPTPQQKCDFARITAWKKYVSCVDTVVAKDAKGVTFDEFKAFAKCRHAYFKKWAGFQTKASLASSMCQPGDGKRFVDNGDGTVTDNLTTLVWEQKDNLDGSLNDSDPHDADNEYAWSTGGPPYKEDGTAFTGFLTTLNGGGGFAGANGWRLPTLAELQTILADFPCTGAGGGTTCLCTSMPCIAFNDSNTQSGHYWSATSDVPLSNYAWLVYFDAGGVGLNGNILNDKVYDNFVRAVRGGL